jgi:hypothetical protein
MSLAIRALMFTGPVGFLLGICVQMAGSKVAVDAGRYVRGLVPDREISDDPLELIRTVCLLMKSKYYRAIVVAIFQTLKDAHSVRSFSLMIRLLSVVIGFPKALPRSPTLAMAVQPLMLWYAGGRRLEIYAGCFTFLFKTIAAVADSGSLPLSLLESLIDVGFAVAPLANIRVNNAVAALLDAAAKGPTFQTLPKVAVAKVIKLIPYSDTFCDKISSFILSDALRPAVRTVDDDVAKFWLDVVAGKATLSGNDAIVIALKTAIAFGDIIILQKLMRVVQNTQGQFGEYPSWLADLAQFILMSKEAKPALAVALMSVIEQNWGKFSSRRSSTELGVVTSFKIGFLDAATTLGGK